MASRDPRTTSSGRSGRGVDNDTYDAQTWGMRNAVGRDGYENDNGYILPVSQAWRRSSSSNPNYGGNQRSMRRDSVPSYDSEEDDYYNRAPRGRRLRKYRSYDDNKKYYDDDDYDQNDNRQDQDGFVKRSMSKLRTTVTDALAGNEEEDGKDNSQAKKWAATVGGALVGGFAGRRAQKDHWVPAAIGAFVGGFAAREIEKTYFRRQDARREADAAWEERHESEEHSGSRF